MDFTIALWGAIAYTFVACVCASASYRLVVGPVTVDADNRPIVLFLPFASHAAVTEQVADEQSHCGNIQNG
jgi:hypothetical protein